MVLLAVLAGALFGAGSVAHAQSTPEVSIRKFANVTEGGIAGFVVTGTGMTTTTPLTVNLTVSQTGSFVGSGRLGAKQITVPAPAADDNGISTVTYTVPTVDDAVDEPDGSVTVTVAAGTGYNVSASSPSATVTVRDNDDPPPATPVVSVTAGAAVTEGGNATFTLTASPAPSSALTVSLTVSQTGSFVASGNLGAKTVTVPTSGTATYTVPTVDDGADEANGAVTVSVGTGSGYDVHNTDSSASLTVNDNDDPPPATPVVSVTAGAAVTEGGNATFTLTASPAPSSALTVSLTVSQTGSFVAAGNLGAKTVTVPTSGSVTYTVPTVDDGADEANGAVAVSVGTGSGYDVHATDSSASLTVNDNDDPPPATPVVSVTAGAAVTEGGDATFTLTASPAPSSALTVSLTVSQTGSFVAAGNLGAKTVTVPTSGTATYTVPTVDDGADEANGAVTVSVGTGTGYGLHNTDSSASVTVNDNDDPPPAVDDNDDPIAPRALLGQAVSGAVLVAAEHFGGGPRSILASRFDLDGTADGDQRPYVALNVGGAIAADNVAEITFTLDGAAFEERVGPRHLEQRPNDDCTGEASSVLAVSVASGGAQGDSDVTFRVEVTDAGGTGLAAGQSICFLVPDLSATLAVVSEPDAEPRVLGVKVTASIRNLVIVGDPFSAQITGLDVEGEPDPIVSRILFQAVPAIAASLGTGGTVVFVNVDDRSRIAQGGEPDPSGRTERAGLRVGTLSIGLAEATQAGRVWRLDGSRTLATDRIDSTLSGRVLVSVAGPFQGGDLVVVGAGPSALRATPDDGLAEVEVPLRLTAGLPIVYLPGGEDLLRPSTFTAGAAYRFNDRDNHDAMILPMSTGTIRFADVGVEGYAYGVHRPGGTDTSHLHVTCEDAADCRLFLQCWSMDNDEHFGAAPDIPARATAVWSSELIADVLGGGWRTGFGRCDLHSTGELAVQHMTRTGEGVLDNNSVVIGRSLNERALNAIRTAVENICNSVGTAETPCTPTVTPP